VKASVHSKGISIIDRGSLMPANYRPKQSMGDFEYKSEKRALIQNN